MDYLARFHVDDQARLVDCEIRALAAEQGYPFDGGEVSDVGK